jgi:hypothetical protein
MDAFTLDCHDDDDTAANEVERRLFAAVAAVKSAEGQCDLLRHVKESAEDAWQRSRARLADLETLRDVLGKQLSELEAWQGQTWRLPPNEKVRSAA